jgi:toxin ParE1/3/4
VKRKVIFAPEAQADLFELYRYISGRSGSARALSYLERIETYCRGFADFPERGTRRDDLWTGLRIVGFEKRVAIAFRVSAETVTINRVLYGGRDLLRIFQREPDSE